jgi:ElaB/YqjD/DUF883 family membrane-anchored ribosome-binding protein
MADESPELIEKEMESTRQSLTEKVAALESTVTGTIQTAASTVKETVESVRTAMQDTVSSVKETVTGSVESVSEGIKQTFDISHHVRENPWAAIGVSAAAGFMTGLLVFRHRTGSVAEGMSEASAPSSGYTPARSFASFSSAAPAPAPAASEPRRPSWVDDLWQMFGDEAKKLGQQALTALSAAAKQQIEQGVPKLFDGSLLEKFGQHGHDQHAAGSRGPAGGYGAGTTGAGRPGYGV